MIELILLCLSHDPDELARQLKRQLGRAHTERHKSLFRVRCHNMAEAEELAHRLPQTLGPGISVGIADWNNAQLTGEDDVRNAFMDALKAPQPAEPEPAAIAEPESADVDTPADPAPASDIPPSNEEAKQEAPAAKSKSDKKRRKAANADPADSTIQ